MNKHVFDRNAWAKITPFEQMGNIGSEVGRAMAAKHKGDKASALAALYRGLDLIDLTSELWVRQHSPRVRELLRAREMFVKSITTEDEDVTLEQYFMQFAVAARLNR